MHCFGLTTMGLILYNIIIILSHSSLFRSFGASRLSSWTKWHLTFNYIFRGPSFRVSLSDLGSRLRGLGFGSSVSSLSWVRPNGINSRSRLQSLGFRVSDLGSRIWGQGFEVSALGSRLWVFGYGGVQIWVMLSHDCPCRVKNSGRFRFIWAALLLSSSRRCQMPNPRFFSVSVFGFGFWFRYPFQVPVPNTKMLGWPSGSKIRGLSFWALTLWPLLWEVQNWGRLWGHHFASIRVKSDWVGQVGWVHFGPNKKIIRQFWSNGRLGIWPYQIREFFLFQKPLPSFCQGWNIACFQDLANFAFWGKPRVVWCIQHDWPKKNKN